MTSYKFATDSQCGTIEARDWNDAQDRLELLVPAVAVEDGAWGWVENPRNMNRVYIGHENMG